MKHYKRILVPLELTAHTLQTLKAACDIKEQNTAELNIVHVLDPVPVTWVVHSNKEDLPDSMERVFGGEINPVENEKQIFNNLYEICKPYNLNKENIHLCMGDAKNEILKIAKKLEIDLIVIGFHRHRGLSLFNAKIAEELLKEAECDVLTVGHHYKKEPEEVEA